MNKKTKLFALIIFFAFVLNIAAASKLSGQWINPAEVPYILEIYDEPIAKGFDVNVLVGCRETKAASCNDANTTLEYCIGQNPCLTFNPVTLTGELKLKPGQTATINFGSLLEGEENDVAAGWTVDWGDAYSGKIFYLRVVSQAAKTDTNRIEYGPLLVASFDINNLGGDTTAPYYDRTDNGGTELVMNIFGLNSIEWCKYGDTKDFSWWKPCNDISAGDTTVTCELTDSALNPLGEGSYTYYSKCWLKSPLDYWSETRRIDFEVTFATEPSVQITSPNNNDEFIIGSLIDFDSKINDLEMDYTLKWDSNHNLDWSSTEENFSSDALGIGHHLITLTGLFDDGALGIQKTDSVLLKIIPVPADVFKITDFEVIDTATGQPATILRTDSIIQINAKITNLSNQTQNMIFPLTIVDAETGQEKYSQAGNYSAGAAETYVYTVPIGLLPLSLSEGNYKIKLDVQEYPQEQNTSNNHASEILTVLEPAKQMNLTELSVWILPVLVVLILIILNKEKIMPLINRKGNAKTVKKKK